MSIICQPAKVIFYPVPKVACTSIKVVLYEANNSVEWLSTRIAYGRVHELPGYQSLPFGARVLTGFEHFAAAAVIRNPVERILSAYRDKARRVVLEGKPAEKKLIEAGLPLEPDPELFFSEIDQYFECAPVIREHMRPFSYHMGHDLSYFEKIVRLENVQEFSEYLSSKLGYEVKIAATNSSKQSTNFSKPVSKSTYKKIVELCSDDLEFLSDYYSVE